jgi:hypothetical protein
MAGVAAYPVDAVRAGLRAGLARADTAMSEPVERRIA